MGKFGPKKCCEWFEEHWLGIKVESDNRVFPISDDGSEVLDVFEKIFAKYRNNIILHYGEWVLACKKWRKIWNRNKKQSYIADIVVITTGGNAYVHTGSTGDGYAFAKNLWHTITPIGPSLSSFLTKELWTHQLSGLTFESSKIENLEWPLLLTHFGISGPLVFMFSSHVAWERINKNTPKTIMFSPISAYNFESLEFFSRKN